MVCSNSLSVFAQITVDQLIPGFDAAHGQAEVAVALFGFLQDQAEVPVAFVLTQKYYFFAVIAGISLL